MKSIIEETGVEAIDTQDNGIVCSEDDLLYQRVFDARVSCSLTDVSLLQVKITARDQASLEKAITIISSLTMVPAVGEIYRSLQLLYLAINIILLVSRGVD